MRYIFAFKDEVNEDVFRRYALKLIMDNNEEIASATTRPLRYITQVSEYCAIPLHPAFTCGLRVDVIYYDPSISKEDKESLLMCLLGQGKLPIDLGKFIPMTMYTDSDQKKLGVKIRIRDGQEDLLQANIDGACRAFGNKIKEILDEMKLDEVTKEDGHTDHRIGFYIVNIDRMKQLLEIEEKYNEEMAKSAFGNKKKA